MKTDAQLIASEARKLKKQKVLRKRIADAVVELATKELSNANFDHLQRATALCHIHLAATRAMAMLAHYLPIIDEVKGLKP